MAEPTPEQDRSLKDAAAKPAGKPPIGSIVVGVVVLVALAVGVYALVRLDSWGDGSANSPQRFQLDLAAQMEVPADLLVYSERQRIDVTIPDPTAIAVAPDGCIYVAGHKAIERIQPDGTSSTTQLEFEPSCLAVSAGEDAQKTRVYVGAGKQVAVLNGVGELLRQWSAIDAKSVLTGIAVAGGNVFVADAGQRVVLRFNADGELLGTIGKADVSREMSGFVIPSPYFDVVAGPEEQVHIVNSGMRRIEAYNYDGELQSYWGQAGSKLPDFFGCCNPAHLALTPDGQFVTSEKGVPRVKVYTAEGELQYVVAGPKQLGVPAAALGDARGNQKERIFDVAVSANGHVLVLDPHHRQVIVFERSAESGEVKS